MIERPPKNQEPTIFVIKLINDTSYVDIFKKIDDEYLYYDKVKYLTPKGVSKEDFWRAVKFKRDRSNTICFGKYRFIVPLTISMQKYLHEIDFQSGLSILPDKNKDYYILSSLMEEAIASSQMEGASTTRKVAKEMLRKRTSPKDKDQQMILNNYNTIRFLVNNSSVDLTPELLLEIHKRITEKTFSNPADEGRFRTDDDILVMDMATGDVIHTPPSCNDIPNIISDICAFANHDDNFLHPVIKGIVIHFMISFLHPFVDGNGRTARSLFYWYMLRKGYSLTEYLSISRIIYRSKTKYERAFLYTEYDEYDLGYFIHYNLNVIEQAYKELEAYLKRKEREIEASREFLTTESGLNARQARILQLFIEKPNSLYTSRDLEAILGVTAKTCRLDLNELAEKGILAKVKLNERLIGYKRGDLFSEKLEEIRGN